MTLEQRAKDQDLIIAELLEGKISVHRIGESRVRELVVFLLGRVVKLERDFTDFRERCEIVY